MNRKLSWLTLAAAVWVLAACSSGNSPPAAAAPPPAAPPPPPATATISGAVVDAFVVNSTITAYEVSATGVLGFCVPPATGACTTATTDANGNFSITITGYSGPVLLQATGGTYTDTVTGQTLSIPSTLTLSVLEPAVAAGNTYTDQLTGLTTMIANQALSLMSGGQSATAALAAATTAIQTQFGVENPAVTALLNLAQANCGTAATDQASFDASLILAGVAQLASQFNVTSADLTAALIIDYKANGGVFTGTLPGGAAIPVGSQAIPLATIEGSDLGVSLYQAIKTYIASVENVCGASESAAQVAALTAGSSGNGPVVYIVDSTSTLFAFDATNGTLLAKTALTTPVNNLNGGGITTDANNVVYVNVGATSNGTIDHPLGGVLAFTFSGTTLAPVTLPAGSFSNVNTPRGIAYDTHNKQFYIGNGGSNLTIYNSTGGYLSDITNAVYGPSGVAYDSVDNTLWVANDTNGNGTNATYGISEFNENGTLAQTINPATQFLAPIQPSHVLPYSIGYCAPSAGGSAVVAVGFLQDNTAQDPGSLGVSEGGVYSVSGTLVGAFSPQLAATAQPNAISCSSTGSIYVAANDGLHIYSTAGTSIALPSGGFTGMTAPLFGVHANY